MDPEVLHQAPLYAILAAVGFGVLAFILLYPVWRFLKREEEVSRHWTVERLPQATYGSPSSGDGATEDPELLPPPPST